MRIKKVVVVISILCLLAMVSCSRCSKGDNGEASGPQSEPNPGAVVQMANEDAQTQPNVENAQGSSGVRQTNVQFVKTPDGKVVPEPVLRLKVPNMLNPQVLKNAIKQQNADMEKKADIKE